MYRRCYKKSFKKTRNNTKKKTTSYKEQCPEKVEKYLAEIKDMPKEDIIYIDETGIEEYIYREYARAPKGEKVYDKISGRKYKRTNIVAGRCGEKNIAPFIYDGNMDKNLFEFWFATIFLDEVEEDKVIVMDNASFHRKNKLYELCKESNKNLKLIFLPPYSPELNPIEKYWAVLKRKVKKFLKDGEGFVEQLCKLL
ncbi:MAG: IS630 family transposase [Paraclostridium sp.]